MSSRTEQMKIRVLSLGWEHWNHRRRAILLLPLLAVVGQLLGVLGGVHLFPASVPDWVVIALCIGATVLVGSVFLALID